MTVGVGDAFLKMLATTSDRIRDMYQTLRPLMFKFDSEKIHNLSMKTMAKNPIVLRKLFKGLTQEQLRPAESKNLKWKHSIGLAAGFDKDAKALDFLDHLGFGCIEVGTVTLEPQIGNPTPRIWRMPEQNSLRNAMGFPSGGSESILPRVKRYKGQASLGVNIGKNKDTPLENAVDEYFELYNIFADYCDYIVINVSSPNTADLRKLQEISWLKDLLEPFKNIPNRKPLYLKISPDESIDSVISIVELAKESNLSGIIATNTSSQHEYDKGGLSGEPIYDLSKSVWSKVLEYCDDDFDLIAVGGFSKKEQFEEYFDLGGKFVQIYTSFIYQGPEILNLD